jgi:hypothetical protein
MLAWLRPHRTLMTQSGHGLIKIPQRGSVLCYALSRKHGRYSAGALAVYSSMKTNRLLVSAVLATAIGAPIAGVVVDVNVAQPVTSTGIQVPFLHGFPTGQPAGQTELTSLERANEWLNSPPLTASALHGKVVLIRCTQLRVAVAGAPGNSENSKANPINSVKSAGGIWEKFVRWSREK